ncbi:hypothetical protein QFZ27_004483 [Inquilinus ginsengisoli]|uniref:hypothetical protein n=1 Tax=Inquilinus ginsengisoli TaxID=363840 RepID=UPI003D239164
MADKQNITGKFLSRRTFGLAAIGVPALGIPIASIAESLTLDPAVAAFEAWKKADQSWLAAYKAVDDADTKWRREKPDLAEVRVLTVGTAFAENEIEIDRAFAPFIHSHLMRGAAGRSQSGAWQARADALKTELEELRRRRDADRKACGLDALEEVEEAAMLAKHEAERVLFATQATTAAGVACKLRSIIAIEMFDDDEDESGEERGRLAGALADFARLVEVG